MTSIRSVMVTNGAGDIAARNNPNLVGYGRVTKSQVSTLSGIPVLRNSRVTSEARTRIQSNLAPGPPAMLARPSKTVIGVPISAGSVPTGQVVMVVLIVFPSGVAERPIGCGTR